MGTALFGWDKTRDMKQNIQDCLVLLLPFRSMLCVGQWQYVFWRVSTFLISLRAFKIPFCDCAYLFSKLTGIEGGGGGGKAICQDSQAAIENEWLKSSPCLTSTH